MAMRKGLSPVTATALAAGLAFLYVPLFLLVIYSFNDSRLVTVWGGWSTRWYQGPVSYTHLTLPTSDLV